MFRYLIIASGKVQGVGFRFFCQLNAAPLNLTGFAKNLDDGDVEIEVQGEKEKLDSFISKIKAGNRFIKITNLNISQISLIKNEKKFLSK